MKNRYFPKTAKDFLEQTKGKRDFDVIVCFGLDEGYFEDLAMPARDVYILLPECDDSFINILKLDRIIKTNREITTVASETLAKVKAAFFYCSKQGDILEYTGWRQLFWEVGIPIHCSINSSPKLRMTNEHVHSRVFFKYELSKIGN